mgnify:CR=1 FL=1
MCAVLSDLVGELQILLEVFLKDLCVLLGESLDRLDFSLHFSQPIELHFVYFLQLQNLLFDDVLFGVNLHLLSARQTLHVHLLSNIG